MGRATLPCSSIICLVAPRVARSELSTFTTQYVSCSPKDSWPVDLPWWLVPNGSIKVPFYYGLYIPKRTLTPPVAITIVPEIPRSREPPPREYASFTWLLTSAKICSVNWQIFVWKSAVHLSRTMERFTWFSITSLTRQAMPSFT